MNAPTGPSSPTPGARPVLRVRHTSHMRLLLVLSITMVVVIGASVLIAWLLTPTVPVKQCRYSTCEPPPVGPPVGTPPGGPGERVGNSGASVPSAQRPGAQPLSGPGKPVQTYPRFTASDGSWSVAYPPEVKPDPHSSENEWTWKKKPLKDAKVRLFGRKAGAETTQDIVKNLIEESCPGATLSYQIPNAMVGYQPGYGEIRDFTPQSGTASYQKGRVFAIVAIKNGVALGIIGVGPYYQFKEGDPYGHPSGANTLLAAYDGLWVNTFMWEGDPPR